jgi:hypothetical protein
VLRGDIRAHQPVSGTSRGVAAPKYTGTRVLFELWLMLREQIVNYVTNRNPAKAG